MLNIQQVWRGNISIFVIVNIFFFLASSAFAQVVGPFVPPNGQKIMIIGQDITSIDNYRSSVPVEPAGVTTYIALTDLSGLINQVDNGGGPNNAGYLQANYPNSVHAIAVYIKGVQANAANGALDGNMDELVRILKSWQRPVFLRFGYEADGPWNENDPGTYVQAFRRMHSRVQAGGADNIAMVWQVASWCGGTYQGRNFTEWYPGDQYVDWLAFSYFTPQDCNNSAINSFMNFANSKNKPIMIAEAAPQRYDIEAGTYNPQVQRQAPDQSKSGQQIWNEWFANFFNYINNNNKIRAVAYINADWDTQSLWQPPYPEGYWGDTRVETNNFVENNWVNVITGNQWLQSSSDLFAILQGSVSPPPPDPTPNPAPTSVPAPGADVLIEAESGRLLGSASLYDDSSASGGQGVAFISTLEAGFSLSNVPASRSFTIWYASQNSGKISVRINGADAGDVSFSTTGGWTGNYSNVTVNSSLPSGASLDIFYENGDAAINVDFIEFTTSNITPAPTPAPTALPTTAPTPISTPPVGGSNLVSVEAESGTILGSASVYDDAGASGGGGVAFISTQNAGFRLAKLSASSSFIIHYASEVSGQISLRINGTDVGNADFSSTGAWVGNYQTIEVFQQVPEGGDLDVYFDNGDSAMNVDRVQFRTGGQAGPTPSPTLTPGPSGNRFFVVHKPTRNKLHSCSSVDGTAITAVSNSDTSECVKWRREANGSYFFLENTGNKFIRPSNGNNGSSIILQPNTWRGNWTQWRLDDRGDGYGHLVNRATGKNVFGSRGGEIQQQPSSWRGDYTRWQFQATN